MVGIHFKNMYIDYDYVSSDHSPLIVEVDVGLMPRIVYSIEENHQSHVNWEKLSENDINHYQCCCKKLCSDFSYFNEALLCRDTHCSSEAHREQLEELYNNFVSDVVSISNDSFKVSYDSRKKTFKVAPGWNDSVKHAHSSAREAYSLWCHVNKPKNGPYFEIMK